MTKVHFLLIVIDKVISTLNSNYFMYLRTPFLMPRLLKFEDFSKNITGDPNLSGG